MELLPLPTHMSIFDVRVSCYRFSNSNINLAAGTCLRFIAHAGMGSLNEVSGMAGGTLPIASTGINFKLSCTDQLGKSVFEIVPLGTGKDCLQYFDFVFWEVGTYLVWDDVYPFMRCEVNVYASTGGIDGNFSPTRKSSELLSTVNSVSSFTGVSSSSGLVGSFPLKQPTTLTFPTDKMSTASTAPAAQATETCHLDERDSLSWLSEEEKAQEKTLSKAQKKKLRKKERHLQRKDAVGLNLEKSLKEQMTVPLGLNIKVQSVSLTNGEKVISEEEAFDQMTKRENERRAQRVEFLLNSPDIKQKHTAILAEAYVDFDTDVELDAVAAPAIVTAPTLESVQQTSLQIASTDAFHSVTLTVESESDFHSKQIPQDPKPALSDSSTTFKPPSISRKLWADYTDSDSTSSDGRHGNGGRSTSKKIFVSGNATQRQSRADEDELLSLLATPTSIGSTRSKAPIYTTDTNIRVRPSAPSPSTIPVLTSSKPAGLASKAPVKNLFKPTPFNSDVHIHKGKLADHVESGNKSAFINKSVTKNTNPRNSSEDSMKISSISGQDQRSGIQGLTPHSHTTPLRSRTGSSTEATSGDTLSDRRGLAHVQDNINSSTSSPDMMQVKRNAGVVNAPGTGKLFARKQRHRAKVLLANEAGKLSSQGSDRGGSDRGGSDRDLRYQSSEPDAIHILSAKPSNVPTIAHELITTILNPEAKLPIPLYSASTTSTHKAALALVANCPVEDSTGHSATNNAMPPAPQTTKSARPVRSKNNKKTVQAPNTNSSTKAIVADTTRAIDTQTDTSTKQCSVDQATCDTSTEQPANTLSLAAGSDDGECDIDGDDEMDNESSMTGTASNTDSHTVDKSLKRIREQYMVRPALLQVPAQILTTDEEFLMNRWLDIEFLIISGSGDRLPSGREVPIVSLAHASRINPKN